MSLKNALMRFLRRGKQADQGFEAMRSDDKALQSEEITYSPEQPSDLEIQRDSLQLGLAAGYTGHSIRNIESSLNRIELQMATKDWVAANFQGTFNMLIDMLKNNQENTENIRKKVEIIEKIVENIENQQISHKSIDERRMTAKMREVLTILQEVRETSYEDLANRLGITIPSLRGLLSIIAKRTDKLKRFEKDNKGWVSYIDQNFAQQSDPNRFQSESQSDNHFLQQ